MENRVDTIRGNRKKNSHMSKDTSIEGSISRDEVKLEGIPHVTSQECLVECEQQVHESMDNSSNSLQKSPSIENYNGIGSQKSSSFYSDGASSDGGLGDTSSSALDQDLLDQQPLNFCERVPLALKLIVISTVSLLGILVVGIWLLVLSGINLQSSARNYYLVSMVEETESMNRLIENEMDTSFRFRIGEHLDASTLLSSWSETDVALKRFSEIVLDTAMNDGTRLSMRAAEVAKDFISQMNDVRQQVASESIDIQIMTQFYTRLYLSILDVSMQLFTTHDIKQSIVQQNILTRIRSRNIALKMIVSAVQLSNFTFSDALFERFAAYLYQRDTNVNLLKAFAHSSILNLYEKSIEESVEYAYLSQIERFVFENRQADSFSFDGQQYFSNATSMSNTLESILKESNEMITNESSRLLIGSIFEIISVIVISICFFFMTILVSFFMARTIIGPWKRMLKLQEMTIQRFVPSEFLIMMKCKRIRDLTRGKAVERSITVLCSSISNFSDILRHCSFSGDKSREITSNPKIVSFLNQYIEYISEVIRYHNGYIDHYERDKLTACFKSPSSALLCSVKYQRAVDTFNNIHSTEYPPLSVTIGVHHVEKSIIATVGESHRIHGTFLNEDFGIAEKLQSLSFRHHVRIMSTTRTLNNANKNTRKMIRYRLICKLRTMLEDTVDCIEILDTEQSREKKKVKSSKVFSAGIDLIYKRQYLEALIKLQSASKMNNDNDPLITYFVSTCNKLVHESRQKMKSITLAEVLKELTLLQSFHTYCQKERSQENIELWNAIEKFNKSADIDERKSMLMKIREDYLNTDSKHCVNLSNQVKEISSKHLEDILSGGMCSTCHNPCTIMSNTVFEDIRDAIELVMVDTFRRFRESDVFRTSFLQSSLVIPPTELFHNMKPQKLICHT